MMKNKKGFTLSETLIAIAILGIIAAISVPVLINTTNKHNYVNGLKRAYLIMKTATAALMADNSGTMIAVATDTNTLMNKYCTKLNCIKKCNASTDIGACFHDYLSAFHLAMNNNNDVMALLLFENAAYAGGATGPNLWENTDSYAKAILSNGMLVTFNATAFPACTAGLTNNLCGAILIDINGFKLPNMAGRDIFQFWIIKNNIVPVGLPTDPLGFTNFTAFCDLPIIIPSTSYGRTCSGRVLTEGKMNY